MSRGKLIGVVVTLLWRLLPLAFDLYRKRLGNKEIDWETLISEIVAKAHREGIPIGRTEAALAASATHLATKTERLSRLEI